MGRSVCQWFGCLFVQRKGRGRGRRLSAINPSSFQASTMAHAPCCDKSHHSTLAHASECSKPNRINSNQIISYQIKSNHFTMAHVQPGTPTNWICAATSSLNASSVLKGTCRESTWGWGSAF